MARPPRLRCRRTRRTRYRRRADVLSAAPGGRSRASVWLLSVVPLPCPTTAVDQVRPVVGSVVHPLGTLCGGPPQTVQGDTL